MKWVSVLSPSIYVLANSLLTDLTLGYDIDEILLIAEEKNSYEKLRSCLKRLVKLWLNKEVKVRVLTGNFLSNELIKTLEEQISENDVVNITAGRKLQAIILFSLAVRRGAKVHYIMVIDEHKHGYKPFGVAPFCYIKPLEYDGNNWKVMTWSRLRPPMRNEGVELNEEEFYAFINLLTLGCNQIRVYVASKYGYEEAFIMKTKNSTLEINIGKNDNLMYCLEASGVILPQNFDVILRELKEYIKRDFTIILDTNVFIKRYTQLFEESLGIDFIKHLYFSRVVYNELFEVCEMKGTYSPNTGMFLVGFMEFTRLIKRVEKSLIEEERFLKAKGDRAFIDEVKHVFGSKPKVVILTEDRALCNLAKQLEIDCMNILPARIEKHELVSEIDKLGKLLWSTAFTYGKIKLEVDGRKVLVRVGWPSSTNLVVIGDKRAKGLAYLVKESIRLEREARD